MKRTRRVEIIRYRRSSTSSDREVPLHDAEADRALVEALLQTPSIIESDSESASKSDSSRQTELKTFDQRPSETGGGRMLRFFRRLLRKD